MLLISETLEAVKKRIIENQKIMELMNLPIINKDDSETIKKQKINRVINKAITTTAQSPRYLGEKVEPIAIDGITYDNYMQIRITIAMLQANSLDSDIFGEPRIEIGVFYDNNSPKNALKILDLISNEFSGKDLEVVFEEDETQYIITRELVNIGAITQVQSINNYEKAGMRFKFYASYYVPNE